MRRLVRASRGTLAGGQAVPVVNLVPVVRLIAVRFPRAALVTTTMEHHGGQDPLPLSLLVADGHQKPPD